MCACSRAALVKIDRRLRTPAQFAAVASARSPYRLQGARRWLALTAYWVRGTSAVLSETDCRTSARLGLVVPKRWARRALDRNLVKRIAREAMHKAGPELDMAAKLAVNAATRLDVVIRLRAPLPSVHDVPRARLRTLLRVEVDALLSALAGEVSKAVSLSTDACTAPIRSM